MAEDQRLTPGAGSLFIAASDRIDDTKAVFRNSIWGFDGANWNRAIVDASGTLKTTGGGGGGGGTVDQGVGGTDPWLIEGEVTIGGQPIAVTGPLTDAELRATPVDVLGPLTDAELRASPVPISGTVTITDGSGPVTVDGTVAATQSGAWTVTIQDGGNTITVDGTVTANQGTSPWVVGDGGSSLTVDGTVAATQSGTWVLGANSGVDIGDVTINNASGASAVNIQDGGNTITVDGTVTADTELETPAALADGQSNPTLPRVGAIVLQGKYVDGTLSFDRRPHHYYQNRTGVGNASGAGTSIDMTMGPCSKFAMYVENQSGTTSAWNINLEGAFAGSDWVVVGNNTSAVGTPQAVWVTERPVRFIRSNVVSVTGGGTCRVRILASQD